jgi:branched-chain amino acid transport system permease protein
MTAAAQVGLTPRWPGWLSARVLFGFAAGLVLLWIAPLVLPIGEYTHNVVGLTFMFMAAALAWNWLGGYVGQISFGHSAMFGVGGFVAARLMLHAGLPFWLAWLAGGLVAGCYALAWGHPTLRLRGPYFSIATIGVGEATRLVATYWSSFTGGSSGLSLPLVSGPTKFQLYWYGLYLLAAAVAVSYWLRRSRVGLALFAIKEDVEAAADLGVNPTRYQDLVLFLSGTMVGVCGGFYASYQAFIDPQDMFSFDRSISFILMAVIGGVGTILGATAGAVVFVIIQEFLLANYSQLYLGLYGTLLILIILFEPLGLAGLLIRVRRLFGYRPRPDVAAGGLASAAAGEVAPGGPLPGVVEMSTVDSSATDSSVADGSAAGGDPPSTVDGGSAGNDGSAVDRGSTVERGAG